MIYNDLSIQPLGSNAWIEITSPRGLAQYVTVDIFGYPPDLPHSTAPGMLGWFYLIGGNLLVVFGVVAFVISVNFMWKILIRLRLHSLRVAQVLFLSLFTKMIIDGGFEFLLSLPILSYPFSILVCELLMRAKMVHPLVEYSKKKMSQS